MFGSAAKKNCRYAQYILSHVKVIITKNDLVAPAMNDRGKVVHTYSVEPGPSGANENSTAVVRTPYTRSLGSNHVPYIRCGRLVDNHI
jgi:hypothetical protein